MAVLGLLGDYHGGGYFVVVVQVEEADPSASLRARCGGADLLEVDADDVAELGEARHFGGVVD